MARIAREQETIIRFNEEDQDIELWSASPRMHRQMKKNGIEPDQISPGRPGAADREESRSYHFPKNYLKIAPKRRVSEEERARLVRQGFGRRQHHGRHEDAMAKHVPVEASLDERVGK